MRLPCLFFLGFIPLYLSCKTNSSIPETETPSSDTLAKYTYLLIGIKKNKDRPGSKEVTNSSGFFFRDSANSLFLVSALHVFRGCSIFVDPRSKDTLRMVRPDTLKVWYLDRSGHYKYQNLPVTGYKDKPCRNGSAVADLDTMNVTAYFKDGNIFSIDKLVADNQPKGTITARIGDTVVCYGFFERGRQKFPPVQGSPEVIALGLSGQIINIPDNNALKIQRLDSIYTAIQPAFKEGYSGAPIFKISTADNKERTVEFAGVQSGNFFDSSFSVMVKANAMNWGNFFNGKKIALHR